MFKGTRPGKSPLNVYPGILKTRVLGPELLYAMFGGTSLFNLAVQSSRGRVGSSSTCLKNGGSAPYIFACRLQAILRIIWSQQVNMYSVVIRKLLSIAFGPRQNTFQFCMSAKQTPPECYPSSFSHRGILKFPFHENVWTCRPDT